LIRRGPLQPERCTAILAQAARALHHAHAAGIIHRDVKPSNILVASGDGLADRTWVVDFGLAKSFGAETTWSGLIRGTPGYMAPEQITGRPMDGRADLFGLACAGFEALTGMHAFEGKNLEEVLFAIVHSMPRRWDLLERSAGAELAGVLRIALAKSPADRWSSGAEMAAALERATRPAASPSQTILGRQRLVRGSTHAAWDEKHTLEASAVWKRYGRKPVLCGVDIAVERGSVYALLGRNGTGKTTFLSLLAGLSRCDRGRTAAFGRDPWRERRSVGTRIGYVPEAFLGYPDIRVGQILRLFRSVYPSWDESLSLKLLSRYKIPIDARIRELSRGVSTQLSLVGALAHRPDLLILDDPTLGLDAVVLRDFFETLQEFSKREGTTVLVSSHNLDEVERIATHVGFLLDGKIELSCPVSELSSRVQGVDVTFRDDPPDLEGSIGWKPVSSRGRRVKAALLRDSEATLAHVRSFSPESIERVDLSLRDVFIALTR
jgi:ABC-2 type transport system ATP-binding protein